MAVVPFIGIVGTVHCGMDVGGAVVTDLARIMAMLLALLLA
jgi:hypothetical protein